MRENHSLNFFFLTKDAPKPKSMTCDCNYPPYGAHFFMTLGKGNQEFIFLVFFSISPWNWNGTGTELIPPEIFGIGTGTRSMFMLWNWIGT